MAVTADPRQDAAASPLSSTRGNPADSKRERRPRVVFMGTPDFAVPSLLALVAAADTIDIVGVYTQPDRRAGRGRAMQQSSVKCAALEHDLEVFQPESLRAAKAEAALESLDPDLVVVAAYGQILSPFVLSIPPRGCVNIHASLLPRHRGAAPVASAIIAGDDRTGVTLMQMDAGLDTGPMITTVNIDIGPDCSCGELTDQLATLGASLLGDWLPALLGGDAASSPQPKVGATYARRLKKADGALDFSASAASLARRVRGMSPWPGAFTFLSSKRLVVHRATALSPSEVDSAGAGVAKSGEVVAITYPPGKTESAIWVACGDGGVLLLLEVQLAGRKRQSAQVFCAGRGIAVGDCLSPKSQ